MRQADWSSSTIIKGYDVETIRELKDCVDGEIFISASGSLVRALLADGLVDELHLFVYPVTVGHDHRLFPEGAPKTVITLGECRAFDSGVVHLTYQPTTDRPARPLAGYGPSGLARTRRPRDCRQPRGSRGTTDRPFQR